MLKSLVLPLATLLKAVAMFSPAAAESVKIRDLSNAGYTCKEVGEARHLCTRDNSPTYGCEQHDCKIIGLKAPVRGVLAPLGGVLQRQ